MKTQRSNKPSFPERRTFLRQSAVLLPLLGTGLPALSAQQQSCAGARHRLIFASPYDSDLWLSSPHMHQQLKHNIEDFSNGKICVEIRDKGQQGVGHELAVQVSRGAIQGALLSVSNLSPIVPKLDILNIPFWAAQSQPYLNLITSKLWQQQITDKILAQGKLAILLHHLPGARTATSTRQYGKVLKTPGDITDIVFRVPASQVLRQFYQLCGTTPVQVEWKKTAMLAASKRFDALDPSVTGLYNGPGGLNQHIGAVSMINSVQDGWVSVINQQWLNSLPRKLRIAVWEGAEKTFTQHLSMARRAALYCQRGLLRNGATIYYPSAAEMAAWQDIGGYQRREWHATKVALLGKVSTFDAFVAATQVNNGLTFPT
ncbi:TRAP transporter substrate-binding protein DctP [Pseudoalteromonas sp. OOF1S-7]|uniref:TRAP transporter substrate-binding protein n=1 Tax=Pseudoalteromonas sp. OOF1S-7 TaxID=2917757 RepID=UPI001EF595E4|nr:TRAP transporter substrate-binding protein DctP [Pseudoalteromonas sp. OOF1S-7]MCG7535203.1 TRAP transporter substrate-binding protein DctP [Pseudoalteromonas sp. OOF1S-7]